MPEIRTSVPYQNQSPKPIDPGDPIEPQEPQESEKSTGIKSILGTIALFLAAPLLALVLILFVIQSYEVDGPSMQQTLQNKDLLIVNKLPRTMSRITGKPYIPPRGHIIIFSREELAGGGSSSRQLVKRVIGLPGERVTVKDGVVTVYNQEYPQGFNPDKDQEYAEKSFSDTPGNVDLVVRENEIFVMGDNRHNSLDSRYFGAIKSEEIVGDLGVRIFPLNKAQTF